MMKVTALSVSIVAIVSPSMTLKEKKMHTVGNLENPRGTAPDPRDGSVFTANYDTNTVLKYCF